MFIFYFYFLHTNLLTSSQGHRQTSSQLELCVSHILLLQFARFLTFILINLRQHNNNNKLPELITTDSSRRRAHSSTHRSRKTAAARLTAANHRHQCQNSIKHCKTTQLYSYNTNVISIPEPKIHQTANKCVISKLLLYRSSLFFFSSPLLSSVDFELLLTLLLFGNFG